MHSESNKLKSLAKSFPAFPVWTIGNETLHPGLAYVIFPSNPGGSRRPHPRCGKIRACRSSETALKPIRITEGKEDLWVNPHLRFLKYSLCSRDTGIVPSALAVGDRSLLHRSKKDFN